MSMNSFSISSGELSSKDLTTKTLLTAVEWTRRNSLKIYIRKLRNFTKKIIVQMKKNRPMKQTKFTKIF